MDTNLTHEQIKSAWERMGKIIAPKPQYAPSSMFPFQSRYKACDVSTREEHDVLSEDLVHGIIMGENQFVVSREMWNIVRERYPEYAVEKLEVKWPEPELRFGLGFIEPDLNLHHSLTLRWEPFQVKDNG